MSTPQQQDATKKVPVHYMRKLIANTKFSQLDEAIIIKIFTLIQGANHADK